MNSVSNTEESADAMVGRPSPAKSHADATLLQTFGKRLLMATFLVGLWAALAGSVILVRTRTYFPVPPVPEEIAALIQPFQPIPPEANVVVNALERSTAYRNTSLSFGVLALATLPLLGLAAGLVSHAPSGLVRGLVTGLALALPVGLVAGVGGVIVAGLIRSSLPDGDPTLLMGSVHAVMWILFALGVALTVVSATALWNRLLPSLVAAAVAAVGASVLYQLGAMVLAPMSRSEVLLPDGVLLSGLFAGLGFILTSLAICYTLIQVKPPLAATEKSAADAVASS